MEEGELRPTHTFTCRTSWAGARAATVKTRCSIFGHELKLTTEEPSHRRLKTGRFPLTVLCQQHRGVMGDGRRSTLRLQWGE